MLLNHNRLPVWLYSSGESLCPCCRETIIAKRPKDKVWHWSHLPNTSQISRTCLHVETAWHLKWKLAYFTFEDWEIEHPVKTPTGTILLDAINPKTHQVREFVHHIAPEYEARFNFLMSAKNHEVMWMFDGDQFASSRRKGTRNGGGLKGLLKPLANTLYNRIRNAKQNVAVTFAGKLWKEWEKDGTRTDTWFPLTGEKAMAVIKNFNEIKLPYEETQQPQPEPSKLDALKNAV